MQNQSSSPTASIDTATSDPADKAAGAATVSAHRAITAGQGGGSSESSPPSTLRQIRKTCLLNMQYHAAREAWLDSLHRWLMFGVIVLGAGAIVDVDPAREAIKFTAGILTAVFGALDLTFDLSNRARMHALMRRRYSEVLIAAERDPDELKRADCDLAAIGGEEEPAFQALIASCHNLAETQVYGDDKEHLVVPLRYRLLQNVWRFSGHVFEAKLPSG